MAPFWIGRHFEISTIKISYIISRHFQNVFIYLNRMKNAKTIGQKRKCTRWRHLGLAAILKCPTSEISYIISMPFQNVFIFKNRFKTAKVIEQTTKFWYHTPS
jgi:arginine exporter protein ArgO